MTDLEYDRVRELLKLLVTQPDLEIWGDGEENSCSSERNAWNLHLNNLEGSRKKTGFIFVSVQLSALCKPQTHRTIKVGKDLWRS